MAHYAYWISTRWLFHPPPPNLWTKKTEQINTTIDIPEKCADSLVTHLGEMTDDGTQLLLFDDEIPKKRSFDMKKLSEGFGFDAYQYLLDGRRSGPLMERKISEIPGYTRASSEKAPYDVTTRDRSDNIIYHEIRCMTDTISFRPSCQTGAGRTFNEDGFYNKLKKVNNFIICDINPEDFVNGNVFYFDISSEIVLDLYKSKKLGKNAQLSRKNFIRLMKDLKIYDRT